MAIWRMGRRSLSLGLTYLFLKTCEGIRDCETIRMSEHSPDDVRCAGYSPSPRPFVSLTIRCPRFAAVQPGPLPGRSQQCCSPLASAWNISRCASLTSQIPSRPPLKRPPPLQPGRQRRRPKHKMQHPPWRERRGLRRSVQNQRPHNERSATRDRNHGFAML